MYPESRGFSFANDSLIAKSRPCKRETSACRDVIVTSDANYVVHAKSKAMQERDLCSQSNHYVTSNLFSLPLTFDLSRIAK